MISPGRDHFVDKRSGEPFTVRGAIYVWIPGPGMRTSLAVFQVGRFDPSRLRQDFRMLPGIRLRVAQSAGGLTHHQLTGY